MPSAEIIAIGTELLLGAIQDTNTAFIARALNDAGIDVFRTVVIGDNQKRISEEIRNSFSRADIVITTGGLGPTVDDPTRDAVADAFNLRTVFIPQLWVEIENRFHAYGRAPSENNRRQAFIPEGALIIHNPVGTAPSFYIEQDQKVLFSLPGVPSEMKTLLQDSVLPIIIKKYQLKQTIYSRIIHTAGIGESSVDELIEGLERNTNPTVGLAAHPGQVDIRITAKAQNQEEAARLINPIENQLHELLGQYIFGADDTTLQETVMELAKKESMVIVLQCDQIVRENCLSAGKLSGIVEFLDAEAALQSLYNDDDHHHLFISLYDIRHEPFEIAMKLSFGEQVHSRKLKFGGHPSLLSQWLENQILYAVWQVILQIKGAQ